MDYFEVDHGENGCPIVLLQKATGGKWKLFILWLLGDSPCRFGQLCRKLRPITQSQLTKALRELEVDGFIVRKEYPQIPPKVEYSLSPLGESFMPVYRVMYQWARSHLVEAGIEQYDICKNSTAL